MLTPPFHRRGLNSWQIVFISISGILGSGLCVRSGIILRIGGPSTVLVAYAVVGMVATLVMFAIGEMICLWPISNALGRFVRKFVDKELGQVVSVAYWFAYSIGFASLIAAAARQAQYWGCTPWAFIFAPMFILTLINLLPVGLYGWTEVGGGVLKTILIFVAIFCMAAINAGSNDERKPIGAKYFRDGQSGFQVEKDHANSYVAALFIAFQIATTSFVGVEIPALAAAEAKLDEKPTERGTSLFIFPAARALKFSVLYLPFLMAVVFFMAGLVASLNVSWSNPSLPSEGWGLGEECSKSGSSSSVFVISAIDSGIRGLAGAFTFFVVSSAWTAANTNLYVASRALHGMVTQRTTLFSWLANTNKRRAPIAAVLVSAIAFIWVPIFNGVDNDYLPLTNDILVEMATVSCVFVWACECAAYLRFYYHMMSFQKEIDEAVTRDPDSPFRYLMRDLQKQGEYPLRTHFQPWSTWIALFACIVGILGAAGSSWLWKGWNGVEDTRAFLSAYLVLLFYFALWLVLKAYNNRHNPFHASAYFKRFKRLNRWDGFSQIVEDLFQLREGVQG
ncbi:hypothetical protein CKM354_000273700 [Cercospora kikuchii]|uniref:Amino acid permease/ SLC12A domain-containing protein n=1 Tax=Cercospora kikuchii TaxID=84275 RepID=A0A9P3CFA5_9PEZI|nr:uncharacterized protein CKM354_000273700 [Cercospora kikuchii]GIZ39350.1 hypothetical protein CKM354_000273700 [Cercospora kikuchii]